MKYRVDTQIPGIGEFVVDRATGQVYRGDGVTAGGVLVTDGGGAPSQVAAPTMDPDGHAGYSGELTVTLACATSGARIRYTFGSEMPSEDSGLIYSGPFKIQGSRQINAIAHKGGMLTSTITSKTFQTTADSGAEQVEFPTEFTWSGPDLVVTRTGSVYTVNLGPDDYIVADITKHRYADAVNGNDANDGLTVETATKTLTNLRTKFGTLTGQKLHVHFVTAGVYPVESAFAGTVDWNMTCDAASGYAVLAVNGKYGADFVIHESGPAYACGTYAATAVFDFSNRDATTGAPQKLAAATGIDDAAKLAYCIANAGTYHNHSDGACYVHTHDGRAPDADLVATYHASITSAFAPAKNTYCKQVIFVGGTNGTLYVNGATAAFNFCFDDCQFVGSASNAFRPELDSGFIFNNACAAYHGTLDGFNYHADGASTTLCVLELGCKAASNGTATGDNATTVHDGVRIVRVNGEYYGGNRCVHDIGDVAASWNFGCSVDSSPTGWRCGDGGGTMMWLDGCSVGTHATADAAIAGAGDAIYYKNMDVSGWTVTGGTLTPW